jgi:molybdate transport system ATP-binding protein
MVKIKILKKLDNFNLDVEFNIKSGEFISIYGKSGSGKTTILRVIAGLERAKANIEVENKIYQNKKIFLPPQKREIGFVFQNYALFENMSVLENLLFANKNLELAKYLLKVCELEDKKNIKPKFLSGGQKQRTALARALIIKPKLLLLDEPLSALDNKIRNKLQDEIKTLSKEFKTTTILVSHDLGEVYKLSDKVLEINEGKIINSYKIEEKLKNQISSQIIKVYKDYAIALVGDELIKVKNKNYKIGDIIYLKANNQ